MHNVIIPKGGIDLKKDIDSIDKWYKEYYNLVNATAVQGSLPNKIMHKLLESRFKSNINLKILEVGSNNGEHLRYVSPDFDYYIMTDLHLPSFKVIDLNMTKNIKFQIANVEKLPYSKNTFDRSIATCVFHHLDYPLDAFRELRRVTKTGGVISILLPNDPGITYRLLRRFTTLRTAKKYKKYYEAQLIHALEHKNHYLQLKTLLRYVFRKDQIETTSFPFRIENYNLNAITVFHITKKRI
jgi:SAM-dependent methyltransferase